MANPKCHSRVPDGQAAPHCIWHCRFCGPQNQQFPWQHGCLLQRWRFHCDWQPHGHIPSHRLCWYAAGPLHIALHTPTHLHGSPCLTLRLVVEARKFSRSETVTGKKDGADALSVMSSPVTRLRSPVMPPELTWSSACVQSQPQVSEREAGRALLV